MSTRSARLQRAAIGLAIIVGASACATGASSSVRSPSYAGVSEVTVVASSLAGDRLASKPPLRFGPPGGSATPVVFAVDDSVRYQSIVGFGASFNEAGLLALDRLQDSARQRAVLASLFDVRDGAGFSLMKSPIAATDFMSATPAWYSYDDTPGDTGLVDFSIARDLEPTGLITYIRRARAAGGDFTIQVTMDYPPDWMLNDAVTNQDVAARYYGVLTNYYLRYLSAYAAEGVKIDYLSPFNEPGHYTKITMLELQSLIRDNLGPALASSPLGSTDLQLSEVAGRRQAAHDYPVVLNDARARSFISELPYHGYDLGNWSSIADLHRSYPDLPVWMTEFCCAVSQSAGTRFTSGDYWGIVITSDLEAGASAWIYWNAILDQGGGPWLVSAAHGDPDHNSQNSVVVVDSKTQTVAYTGLYYYLAHFSRFVRPGAIRIETRRTHTDYVLLWPADSVRAITFQNPDGTIVSELINSSSHPASVRIDWDARSLSLTLQGTSITTLGWRPLGPDAELEAPL